MIGYSILLISTSLITYGAHTQWTDLPATILPSCQDTAPNGGALDVRSLMSSLLTGFAMFRQFLFSVLGDLKNIRIIYHHVDIAPAYQRYLVVCFLFIVQGALRYFVFAPLLKSFIA